LTTSYCLFVGKSFFIGTFYHFLSFAFYLSKYTIGMNCYCCLLPQSSVPPTLYRHVHILTLSCLSFLNYDKNFYLCKPFRKTRQNNYLSLLFDRNFMVLSSVFDNYLAYYPRNGMWFFVEILENAYILKYKKNRFELHQIC
jgi:hypothetical protein